MQIIDNTSHLLGDDLKATIGRGARLRIAASCFSIYAFESLKAELSKVESLQFVFTAPTFIPTEVTDRLRKERREFFIPKARRESGLYGTEFEIQLRNKLTQRAVARECAEWIQKKARFRSNATKAPMQQFMHATGANGEVAYMPISGFTAVDLGYQKGDAVSNFVTRFDDPAHATMYLQLFDQIWSDPEKVKDVTAAICEHIESVYQENSPERIYFMMLYNIFHDFLNEVDEDVLPNDLTGYQDSLVWNKLFNYQKDAATGIINKLETYNGCILADSVGLGKTFTALAVIKYYELRNRSVLVLCPKKLADNWRNYNTNLTTNIFAKDRFNYDVLAHTDLSRTSGESFGIPLNRVNWGNYDLIVIDESHNFRNNDVYKDRETRYQKLMNKVIRAGVKTKVLMLSATPVNNRFTDLRNQLALAYEGQSEALSKNLKTHASIEETFRRAQKTFNEWSSLPPEERTAASILKALDFDFFELLDAVTIARSRKHIETFYDTRDIGKFPQRRKPLSFHRPITERSDVMGFNDIFTQLSVLKLAVYAPISYILPSRRRKYEEAYDTRVEGGRGKLRQADRERSLQALMTTNLLKRLESSVAAFRLTLRSLENNISRTLDAISEFERTGRGADVSDHLAEISDFDPEDDDLGGLDEFTVGKKVQISLGDKRPSESDSTKWVLGDYFAGDWLPEDAARTALPVALNMGALYERLLEPLVAAQTARLIPGPVTGFGEAPQVPFTPARPEEAVSLAARIAQADAIQRQAREVGRITARLAREKQFNKRVGINAELRAAKQELERLTTGNAGEANGDVSGRDIRRIQIRETIKAHLDKEKQLFAQGIKVLSLFFIDEVVKYRDYGQADEKGEYARVFEEEYELLKAEYLSELAIDNEAYRKHLAGIDPGKTHNGYFSIDKKTNRLKDPVVGTRSVDSDDVDAYDLILKDKERLLSFTEPTRFIFSHSALREGWDNPNVFVMCMLKHSDNTISRRQEVGRGLRLSVDQHGDRMDRPGRRRFPR